MVRPQGTRVQCNQNSGTSLVPMLEYRRGCVRTQSFRVQMPCTDGLLVEQAGIFPGSVFESGRGSSFHDRRVKCGQQLGAGFGTFCFWPWHHFP